MDKLSVKETQEKFNKIDKFLKENGSNIPKDLENSLKEMGTILAVDTMNHWLPRGAGRKLMMLIILIIGLLGAMSVSMKWLFILLLLPFFSPKVIMYASIIIGYALGNDKKSY